MVGILLLAQFFHYFVWEVAGLGTVSDPSFTIDPPFPERGGALSEAR